MSSDLEKFLQQAAERLAQKAKASGRPASAPPRPSAAAPSSPRRPEPPRKRELFAPTAEVIEAEVIDIEERHSRLLREAGSDPLSTIDTRPSLAQSISQADERMGSHVHQVFDHEITQLKAASSTLSGSQPNQSDQPTEVSFRATTRNPLIEMLRNPETLRAAFIAGEIFNRRTW